ncbi:mediator of RNA polymerase II transcription subunit 18-like [Hydractinia symbiolongicarpus]|uniref:mediator of RNA polymerase II transcription subunit 18-like n=1 Tax=Hydractinia symbiolongicarpus TaxID=13093 RepID=UPI00254AAFB4|nr:mediator of RNA polymerase II transcription subunit 18-like [Hydractinia symbiolongicarpus]
MNLPQNKNQIQYVLAGSVPASNLKFLLHRLRGLCEQAAVSDNCFEDHEAVYTIKSSTTSSSSVSFRVRRSLAHTDAPHQVRYLGAVEGNDKNRAATMRNCIEVDTNDSITSFLEQIGFQFDHETILRGFLFRKGAMRITVSRLHKIPEKGVFSNMLPMTDSYLVELTLNTLVQQDSLCLEMRAFAEHLKPIVLLEKIEPKR